MKEVKVVVVYTDGYQQRYTKACLEVIRKREIKLVDKGVEKELA